MARRKTLKKAQYLEFPNCFTKDHSHKGKWRNYFGNDFPLILELGCGKAELSLALAEKYPQKNFLGIDLKMDRMWWASKEAARRDLPNLAFLCINLLEIGAHFEEGEVDEIWITFPDPFPKKRQIKHRMITPPFLENYQKILIPGGKILYKTDNLPLFQYSLEVFVRQGNLTFHKLSFDLHGEDDFPQDWKFETTYEKEFRAMGDSINFVAMSFTG
ncbi:MAG: tRNA (guanosine(46)-N7)-methyltransferase TrmB [Bacteroidota bacterium]